jgi:hypothetical protein
MNYKEERHKKWEKVLERWTIITENNWDDVLNDLAWSIDPEEFDSKVEEEAIEFIRKSGKS